MDSPASSFAFLAPYGPLYLRLATAAERTLLNFEAVDYRCQVMVNGKQAGGHRGGNTPFTVDITDRVRVGEN